MFLIYAVIWGLLTAILPGAGSYALAEDPPAPPVPIEEAVRSLDDPFDVQVRAPGIVALFLKGIAELKRQVELKEKQQQDLMTPPVTPVAEPLPVAKPKEPVKPKKLEIPAMKITGIVYDTDNPQAIINGKVVGVGSDLNGVSILAIQKGRIDARYEGSDISLKFNNE